MLLARNKREETRWTKEGISVDEMQSAETVIAKHVQRQSFKEEFDTLQMTLEKCGRIRLS